MHTLQLIQSSKSKNRPSLHGNFAKRSANHHLDQENQCLRTGKCGNADLGQQMLGNDNSVTGSSDQRKNEQNRVIVVTPTPKVMPTPVVTPTPPQLHHLHLHQLQQLHQDREIEL
jgi:hypothetical protein